MRVFDLDLERQPQFVGEGGQGAESAARHDDAPHLGFPMFLSCSGVSNFLKEVPRESGVVMNLSSPADDAAMSTADFVHSAMWGKRLTSRPAD